MEQDMPGETLLRLLPPTSKRWSVRATSSDEGSLKVDQATTAGGIQAAVGEAQRRAAQAVTRGDRRALLRWLIRWTDAMIEALELENLSGASRVGERWRSRLIVLFASLPFAFQPWLRAFPTPGEVLDVVYDVQAHLFGLMSIERRLGAR
jgi:hypothetical protein